MPFFLLIFLPFLLIHFLRLPLLSPLLTPFPSSFLICGARVFPFLLPPHVILLFFVCYTILFFLISLFIFTHLPFSFPVAFLLLLPVFPHVDFSCFYLLFPLPPSLLFNFLFHSPIIFFFPYPSRLPDIAFFISFLLSFVLFILLSPFPRNFLRRNFLFALLSFFILSSFLLLSLTHLSGSTAWPSAVWDIDVISFRLATFPSLSRRFAEPDGQFLSPSENIELTVL